MEICKGGRGSFGHAEIVHDESTCPLCRMIDDKAELESQILKSEAEIDRLNAEE